MAKTWRRQQTSRVAPILCLLAAGYQAEDEGEKPHIQPQALSPNRKVPRGGDRASLSLHENQQQLITTVCDANKKTQSWLW
jgi:hypothetical protein